MVNAYLFNAFMITMMVAIVVAIMAFIIRKISNVIHRAKYLREERDSRINHLFSKCDYIREEQSKDYSAMYTRYTELRDAIETIEEKLNKKEIKNVKKKKRN